MERPHVSAVISRTADLLSHVPLANERVHEKHQGVKHAVVYFFKRLESSVIRQSILTLLYVPVPFSLQMICRMLELLDFKHFS